MKRPGPGKRVKRKGDEAALIRRLAGALPQPSAPSAARVTEWVSTIKAKAAATALKKLLGEQQVVDLTGVAGTYVGVAMLLAMAEQGVPADKEPPFKDGEP